MNFKTFNCEICGFGSISKFHYNSHMNTHTTHQCLMCNYTTRTEVKVRKHMMIWHTFEQRRAVGIEEDLTAEPTRGSNQPTYIRRQEKRQTLRSGAIKTYTCKQCGFTSETKEGQWVHVKTHIPKDKQLTCTKCQFVTEHRQHMTYHKRNHSNSKPFNCNKSHDTAYPYRCQDCKFQTKYCNGFKIHLAKYNHRHMRQEQANEIEPSNGPANLCLFLGFYGNTIDTELINRFLFLIKSEPFRKIL